MSDQPEMGSPSGDELQFDRVEAQELAAAGPSCTACQQPIAGAYYMANNGILCLNCREQLRAELTGGSRLKRVFKGTVYGVGGGALGAGIYFAVLALTGYEVGLIAIVVGVIVGAAVRAGSDARGGWFYQLLAMFITYCAIVSTYVPMIAKELEQEFAARAEEESASQPAPATNTAAAHGERVPPAERDRTSSASHKGSIIGRIILYAISFIVAFLSPILVVDVIGYIIKGIALYEAWKINKRLQVTIAGPFQLAAEVEGQPVAGMEAEVVDGVQEEPGRG